MSDTAPKNDAQKPAEESKEKTSTTPPWGDDFDPARAWETITRQREAEKELKDKLAAYEKAEQERADAEKTELEKLQARLEKAEADVKAAQRAAVLAKSGLPEELHGFITGDTEEAIADQVAKLTAALGASDKGGDKEAKPSEEEQKPSGRPQAALTPGHGGEEATFDADAIVAAVL